MSNCSDCSCGDFEKCEKLLHLVLDGEATEQEEEYLYNHIEKCITCFSKFNIELQIRELVKTKLKKKTIPSSLIDEIKLKIT